MQSITPCLWFDNQAEEAAKFYVSVFKNSKIATITRYGNAGPLPKGTAMTVSFHLNGEEFLALNGGPAFKFNESISLVANCESQHEVDALWDKLTSGGGYPVECGWIKDKYGVSWQIVPSVLNKMMTDPVPEKADRVIQALLHMKKPDIAARIRTYEGK